MRKIWALCAMELRKILKKKQSYLVMFGMPLLFTLIFGSLLGGEDSGEKVSILLVDQDQSALSQSFYREINKDNTLFHLKVVSAKKAEKMLEDKKTPAALIIKKGFQEALATGKAPQVLFQRIPEFTSSSSISQTINDHLAKIAVEVNASRKWSEYTGEAWQTMYSKVEEKTNSSPMTIEKQNINQKRQGAELSGMSARAAGFSIMFVMIMMMSVTGTILEARTNGVWYRMMTMPASRFQIIAGYLLSFFFLGWIQFGVLILATHYIFHVNWGNPLALTVLVSALLLAVIGIGLFIAGMVKTVEQQASIGNLLVVATCMLSGVYWPLEIEPEFMQKVAHFLPQTWALDGFNELLGNGGTLADILVQTGVLLGFAIIFLVIGMRRVRFQ